MKQFLVILLLMAAIVLGAARVSAQSISLPELVELFIKLGIIAPEKANQARSAVSNPQIPSGSGCYLFVRNFGLGSRGLDVGQLHKVLIAEGLYSTTSDFDVGSSAVYTAKTALSVSRFQERYISEILTPNGLSRGTGYVGVSTRAKMNLRFGCSQVQPTPNPTPNPTPGPTPVITPPFLPIGPELEVRYPNGEEMLKRGGIESLRWVDRGSPTSDSSSLVVDLRIIKNVICAIAPCPRVSYVVATNVYANNHRWIVGNTLDGTSIPDGYYYFQVCRVRSNICDQSNSVFRIVTGDTTTLPSITVTSPNEGGEWQVGQSKKISWLTQSIPASAYLELALVGGPTPINIRSYNPIGSNSSLEFILPVNGIWTDYSYPLQPGSYSISAVVYDLPPCGPMIPILPDSLCRLAKILAKDSSDFPFTITSGLVLPPPPPLLPTVTLSTTLSTVTSGSATTISWSSTDATSCSASGAWTGTKALAGSQSTNVLTTNSTFTITCAGAGGAVAKNVTVTVTTAPIVPPSPPQLIVSCAASVGTATVGQALSWTAIASGGGGSYAYSWSGTDALTGNSQIVSKSYSTVGSKTAVVTVTSGTQSVELSCTSPVSITQTQITSHLLIAVRQGSGNGTISGGSVNCGTTCSTSVIAGTQVALNATASTGSIFAGWTGACSGTGACFVTMDSSKTVTATFNLVPIASPLRISFVGDWHNRPVTEANLRNARDNSDLLIGLGDYSYINGESPTSYCDMVKRNLGNVPLLVMPGDHDDLEKGSNTNGIDIRNLLPCLPVKPSGELSTAPVGVYPYRYYVDLKNGTRLIVAGGIGLKTGITEHIPYADNGWHKVNYAGDYNWALNSPIPAGQLKNNYNWLRDTIDSAQVLGSGIKHIIVANHEPCLDISETTYDRNRTNCTDAMNLMIEKGVDMFIHGSKHHYWRSKQIGYTPTCSRFIMPTSPSGTHPSVGCVKEAVGSTQYTKGAGLVHLTVGTGGADPNGCNIATSQSDNEYPFAYASTCTKEAGIAILTINDTKIDGVFKRSTGTTTDTYSIAPSPVAYTPPSPSSQTADLVQAFIQLLQSLQ